MCKSNSGFRLFYNSILPDHTKLVAIDFTVQTQPQPITPNVLFSVEKRRKSQLFDKDKWQQQRLVFAGESDEDQNSQEGDGSGDSEVSSPAMDEDRRRKWLANTSVNRCDECLIHFSFRTCFIPRREAKLRFCRPFHNYQIQLLYTGPESFMDNNFFQGYSFKFCCYF